MFGRVLPDLGYPKVQWQKKKIGFIKIRVPVFHSWRNLKTDGATAVPWKSAIQLVKKDNATIAISVAEPKVRLEGQEVFVRDENLRFAKANISQTAYNALQSAIDLAKLKRILPEELQDLNMTVVSTRFRNAGGHAIAEINLSARVSGNFARIFYLH